VRQTEYEYVWVIGAASPQTGQAEAILSPVLNTAIINQFLDQFSRALPSDVHAAMIWDGAGFHRAHDLVVPANITLIPLPPYSPELNGIENLWHYLRSHCWSNRAYHDYEELFEVASESWCRYGLDTELIKSVCAKNYIPTRS
jgi:transposase